jgi:UDP-glucose 4-epimerase
MSTVLVTGGAGFIGSHLCEALVHHGHQVIAIDDLSLGRKENVSHLPAAQFTLQVHDLLDEAAFRTSIQGVSIEHVFHLAANSDVSRSSQDPTVDLHKTFLTTFAVLQQMREHGLKKIVFASTPAVYGEVRHTIPENYGPLFPLSHYGAGKLASEAFIASFVANYGLQAWILRFPNIVGERATHGVVFDFINKLRANPHELEVLGSGEQTKPYVYVRDLVEAILFVWQQAQDQLNYFHIGVESRTKVKDIAAMVAHAMKLTPTIRYVGTERGWVGDQMEYAYDVTKVHRLGWKAPRTSDEAVRLAIERMLAT